MFCIRLPTLELVEFNPTIQFACFTWTKWGKVLFGHCICLCYISVFSCPYLSCMVDPSLFHLKQPIFHMNHVMGTNLPIRLRKFCYFLFLIKSFLLTCNKIILQISSTISTMILLLVWQTRKLYFRETSCSPHWTAQQLVQCNEERDIKPNMHIKRTKMLERSRPVNDIIKILLIV